MPLSQQIQDQIRKEAYDYSEKSWVREAYVDGATSQAEKAQCLIEALEKIAYGYDNDDSRPGVHIGYSGAQSIATAALQEYTNSLK